MGRALERGSQVVRTVVGGSRGDHGHVHKHSRWALHLFGVEDLFAIRCWVTVGTISALGTRRGIRKGPTQCDFLQFGWRVLHCSADGCWEGPIRELRDCF